MASTLGEFLSLKWISWFFAVTVFGSYIGSVELQLLGLMSLADEALPIRMSIGAWGVTIGLIFVGQFVAKPIRWANVAFGALGVVASWYAIAEIWPAVSTIVVPGFLVFYHFELPVRLAIGLIFGLAYLYVLVSPFIWTHALPRAELI